MVPSDQDESGRVPSVALAYATTSRPFPTPDTGQIAIKVINHYGDEVMQVYDVGAA